MASTIEVARKRRHLELLQRVQANRPLSAGELRELQDYEKPAPSIPAVAPAERIRIRWKRCDPSKEHQRPPVTAAVIKRLAFESTSMAHADARVDCDRSLAEVLAEWVALDAAWARGQLLRNLEGLASAIMTVNEAAKKLGFDRAQDLRQLLDTDSEARSLWEQTRLDTVIAAKRALVQSAKDGNQAAIRSVETFLRDDKEGPSQAIRFGSVPIRQVADLLGVARQTVHEWYSKQGLPRNADGNFDLGTTIAWWGEFIMKKAAPTRGALSVADRVHLQKMQRVELQIRREKGELVERVPVINRIVLIFKGMIAELDRLVRDVGPLLPNKTPSQIQAILEKYRSEFIQKQRNAPDELALEPQAQAKFEEFYRVLCPEIIGPNNDSKDVNKGALAVTRT